MQYTWCLGSSNLIEFCKYMLIVNLWQQHVSNKLNRSNKISGKYFKNTCLKCSTNKQVHWWQVISWLSRKWLLKRLRMGSGTSFTLGQDITHDTDYGKYYLGSRTLCKLFVENNLFEMISFCFIIKSRVSVVLYWVFFLILHLLAFNLAIPICGYIIDVTMIIISDQWGCDTIQEYGQCAILATIWFTIMYP